MHFGQPIEGWIDQAFARLEFGGGGDWSFAVPGANVLTDVAAEDVASDAWAQVFWNLATLFDGQVGDAEAGVEFTGRDNGVGGTGGYAAGAGSATIGGGQAGVEVIFRQIVLPEIERSQDYAEEEPRSELLVDDAGVLADPSYARVFGVDTLDKRAGVDVGTEVRAVGCQWPVESSSLRKSSSIVWRRRSTDLW